MQGGQHHHALPDCTEVVAGEGARVRQVLLDSLVPGDRGAGESLCLPPPLRGQQGGGGLGRSCQPYLRQLPAEDDGLAGSRHSVRPGPVPVRDHLRGPGGPLVQGLLPGGSPYQPPGPRAARSSPGLAGQWDRGG